MLIQNVTSLVMLPIYTRFLTPEDYGIVEVLMMVLDVTAIMFGMRVEQGLFRYFHHYGERAKQLAVVSTVFIMVIGLNLIGAIVLVIASPVVAAQLLHTPDRWELVAWYSTTLVSTTMLTIPMAYVRLDSKPQLYLAMSVLKLLTHVALNLLFVVYFQMKVLGVILSTVITQIGLGAIFSGLMLRQVGVRFDRPIARQVLTFSIPLVLSSVASFYLAFGDRFFLTRWRTLAEVGLYGLAYRFGFAFVGLAYQPFQKSWDSGKYEALKSENPQATYRAVFSALSKFLLVVAMGLCLFIGDFLHLFVGKEFRSAAALVPLLVFAYVCKSLGDFCSFGLYYRERTKVLARTAWATAAFMTLGFVLLIPRFGAYGAAITTLLGFFAEAAMLYFVARRHYDMGLQWTAAFTTIVVVLVAVFAGSYIPAGSLTSILSKGCIFLAGLALIYFSPATSAEERKRIDAALAAAQAMLAGRLRRAG